MPIKVQHRKGKWVVINTETGKVHGTHASSREAYAQLYAMKKSGVDTFGKKE